MESKTKRLLLIGGSVVVIAGVAWYLYSKNKSTDASDEPIVDENTLDTKPASNTSPNDNPNKPQLPVELRNLADVKKFQDFMDSIGPWVKGIDGKYKKLNKGAGYGIAGPSTVGAFTVYGDLYRVYLRSGAKGKIVPIIGTSPASIDINLSNGTIARYQRDNKFVHFASAYGSVKNTGTWTKGGRKIVLTFGPKKGTIDKDNMWDTLKSLIA